MPFFYLTIFLEGGDEIRSLSLVFCDEIKHPQTVTFFWEISRVWTAGRSKDFRDGWLWVKNSCWTLWEAQRCIQRSWLISENGLPHARRKKLRDTKLRTQNNLLDLVRSLEIAGHELSMVAWTNKIGVAENYFLDLVSC